MVSTDPIADMFTRIRNAIAVNKDTISVPHSKAKETVARILVENGFLDDVKVDRAGHSRLMDISINPQGTSPKITELSRISKPGRRIYAKAAEIPKVKRGRGMVIISTSQGVMTGQQAKDKKLGGELICKVY